MLAVMASVDLPTVLRGWRAAGSLVSRGEPATSAELARVEVELGRPLPPEMLELYAACNGVRLAGGDLALHALHDADHLGVANASRQLREWEWPVPPELLVVGDNGAGEAIGLWVVPDAQRAPVVLMGTPTDELNLAVVGTTLAGFLAASTAYSLPLAAPGDPAVTHCLDELGVPAQLRGGEDDEDQWALLAWASPDLPDPRPDPYERPMTPEDITRLARSSR